MTISTKFKTLLAITLLGSSSAASAEESNGLAPEATAAQTELSFRDIPLLENAFIDTAPTDRNDGISVGELGIDGGSKDRVVALAREIADGKHGKYDSLLVAHKDKLLFESYYLRGRINLAHGQASATKAYTSLALGRAIQLGYLTMADLNKPLISFLDELDHSKLVEGAEKITLHKALTMHGGLNVDRERWEELEKNPAPLQGQGLVQTLLEHSGPIIDESQIYRYGNFNPNLVMAVIDAVVPGTAKDFIKKEILDKLGIANYSWDTHVSGLPQAGWMVSMTSRDMLKWGSVVLNEGKWNGEQFVPADYLAKATSGLVKPTEDWMPDTYRYGYFFYQAPMVVGDKSYNATFAWGGGGQRIIVVDELDLTIVITGHDREDQIMAQISNAVLPVFAKVSSGSDVRDEISKLKGPYLGQKPPGLTPEAFAPGIVSLKGWEYGGVFTPDTNEFYFLRRNEVSSKQEFVLFQHENNQWRESVVSPRVGQAFISPDGKIMHLGKRYKERRLSGWSEIKGLGSPFEEISIMRLTSSAKGTLVFDEFARDGNAVLRYSRLIEGKREAPKPLSKEINTGRSNAHPFIAPDESYILWDSKREGGYGNSDIYLSFRQQDGSWGEAINLGDKINTDAWEAAASVTPDGKYLFFNRNMGSDKYENVDIFWVDAQVIENLRPKM